MTTTDDDYQSPDPRSHITHANHLLGYRLIDGETRCPHPADVNLAIAHAVTAIAILLDTPIPDADEVQLLRGVRGLALAPTNIPVTMPPGPPAMRKGSEKR